MSHLCFSSLSVNLWIQSSFPGLAAASEKLIRVDRLYSQEKIAPRLEWMPLVGANPHISCPSEHCTRTADLPFVAGSSHNRAEIKRMKRALVLSIVLVAAAASVSPLHGASPAELAFQKLQSLVGEWEGNDAQGNAAKTNFKLMVANTAMMETLTPSGMDEMVTLYSLDGDAISLLHYCPTNNRPHMRALPVQDVVRELVFTFQDAGNLPSLAIGHEHKLVMQFQDRNHLIERWTWRGDGKDTETVYHFVRKVETLASQKHKAVPR